MSVSCIKEYIDTQYRGGGLIGISDLAEYCKLQEGLIYVSLIQMQNQGIIEVVKRYHCPVAHVIATRQYPYCSECDYSYADDLITSLIYVKPLPVKRKAYSS
jgi:hypothetical protein